MGNDTQAAEQTSGKEEPKPGRSTADAAAGAALTTARWTAQLRPPPVQRDCASTVPAAPAEQHSKASEGRPSADEASRATCSQPPAGRHNGTKAQPEQQAGGERFEGDESAVGTVYEQHLGLLRSLPSGDITELSKVHTQRSPAACSMPYVWLECIDP